MAQILKVRIFKNHLNEELTKGVYLSWAAYHASVTELPSPLPCLSSLLPLFYEKAATVAMMKHGMFVIKEATEFLNPYQIAVTLSCWEAYTLRWFCGPCAVTY